MSDGEEERRPGTAVGGGIIALFARHPTAANLLMAIMIIAGIFSLTRLNTQFFPDFGIDIVSVTVVWPGASAEDVDDNIVQAVEPEVRFLDGVKRVFSSSYEGRAVMAVEFLAGTDMQRALNDVETAIAQITILPENSEKPIIKRLIRYDTISRLIISGPYPEASLKRIAKRVRDGLLARGIDKVDMFGARDEEIWVEIPPAALLRLNLTLDDVAKRIAETSQDVPSGDTSGRSVRQIRSLGLVKTARGIADIEVKALENGQKVYLRDIARVSEEFEDGTPTARHAGQRAIELHIRRSINADALEIADEVERYLVALRPTLPPNLKIVHYDIASNLIRSRIDLLLRNGATGLVLVLLVLFLFLSFRVGFWVAAGIPISLMATMLVMLASGQTINMVSLFGLIMVIGIIVDDAIVVGEHAEMRFRAGQSPLDAAETGARRMAAPVLSASLTTIAAFVPLFIITGIIGQIIQAIPLVVVAVILASLVESFFVLPGHLRHAFAGDRGRVFWLRKRFNEAFDRFRDGWFRDAVTRCIEWRYATLAAALACLIVSFGLVMGGRVGFLFFPSPEADKIYANVQFAAGTPRPSTSKMVGEIERALVAAEIEITGGKRGLVKTSLAKIGDVAWIRPGRSRIQGDHVGGVVVELVAAEFRTIKAAEFIAVWRRHIDIRPGVESLTILQQQGGPPGREIDVRLSGSDPAALKAAAKEVKALLASYPGVSDIEDDLPYGKRETILEVTPRGRALGFTTESVGRQVRNAFEGAIAKRFARGDEEVLVRVKYSRGSLDTAALGALYLRGPTGAEVPLSAVVKTREKLGFARIRRQDGERQVAITAEIDKSVTVNATVLTALQADGMAGIAARHGLTYRFAGRAEEQKRTFGDMRVGALIGLCAIYIILAWVFSSYTRPLVVMSVIPLGFVGATIGHLLLGFDLTILSLVALIGLSGIVVNDSIILVTTVDERLARGEDPISAIIDGSRDRLRAVVLTSATTIGGLTPLLFETDLQAQFLIPMAVTIVFGLLLATLMVLIVVPALMAVQGDVKNLIARAGARRRARIQAAE